MNKEIQAKIEKALTPYPIYEYAFIKSTDVPFSEKVRFICESECPMYGKSWSCPPAVGSVGECLTKLRLYRDIFIFSTVSEVADITSMESTLPARREHQQTVRAVLNYFRENFGEVTALSAEACALCEKCVYPQESCRHPQVMLPCIESQGIIVTELAERCGMAFMLPGNTVVWFGMIFFNS